MNDLDIEALLFQGEHAARDADAARARKHVERRRPGTDNSDFPDFTPFPKHAEKGSVWPTGADGRDSGRQERRSRLNRYSAEREENDEIRARRTKDLDDGKNGSEKDSTNGTRSRDQRRARSRSPRGHRHEGPRDQGRLDRYMPGDRSASYRERDYIRRPESRGRYSRDDRRVSDRDGHGRRDEGDRYRRPSPAASNRKVKTPEPTTEERDRRTVFVQQLAQRLRTKDLEAFFKEVGQVVEAQIVKDRVSGRSKGVGYVEFKDEESVQKAIGLTGKKLCGIPIIAQLTEAEKNRQAKTEGGANRPSDAPFHRLYVGNIHFSVSEDDIKAIFSPFGELEFVCLQTEDSGRSKGYGFVQFVNPTEAKDALAALNGKSIAGREIRVGLGNDRFTSDSTRSLLHTFDSQGKQAAQGSSFSGLGGRGQYAGGSANFDRAGGRDADKAGNASALDDTDIAGASNSFSRHKLMEQLSRSDHPTERVATTVVAPKKAAPMAQAQPSRCILLEHMWSTQDQIEDPLNWQEGIKRDVLEQCDEQYGKAVHIGISLEGDIGEVYVKFAEVAGGIKAYQGLNGRKYDGRTVTAQYVVEAIYNVNFREAKNL